MIVGLRSIFFGYITGRHGCTISYCKKLHLKRTVLLLTSVVDILGTAEVADFKNNGDGLSFVKTYDVENSSDSVSPAPLIYEAETVGQDLWEGIWRVEDGFSGSFQIRRNVHQQALF
jgi:hypothetical protein